MSSNTPHGKYGSTHSNAPGSTGQITARDNASTAPSSTRIVLTLPRTSDQVPFEFLPNYNRPPLRNQEIKDIVTENSVRINVVFMKPSSGGVDSQGSGFIVGQSDDATYVVTNRHVVANYDPEKSTLKHQATGQQHTFVVVATGQPELQEEIDHPLCAGADLALLRTDIKPTRPPPLISLKPGLGPLKEMLFTFGYPLGVGRFQEGAYEKRIDLFAQNFSRHHRLSDMARMPGYYGASGSPVIDARGDVVGVLDSMDDMDQQQGTITKFVPAPYLRCLLERNGVKYIFDKRSAGPVADGDRVDSPGPINMIDV